VPRGMAMRTRLFAECVADANCAVVSVGLEPEDRRAGSSATPPIHGNLTLGLMMPCATSMTRRIGLLIKVAGDGTWCRRPMPKSVEAASAQWNEMAFLTAGLEFARLLMGYAGPLLQQRGRRSVWRGRK